MGNINSKNELNKTQNMFIDPNPHAFHMFENFDLNQKIFESEQKLVQMLKKVRIQIQNFQKNLNELVVKKKRKTNGRIPVKIKQKSNNKRYLGDLNELYLKQYISKKLSTFPKKHDYDGAVKGMVILQNTYNFDLQKAIKSGDRVLEVTGGSELLYYDFSNAKEVSFRANEALDFDDFLMLSHKAAYYYHFYDTSIQLLVTATYMYKKAISSPNLHDYFLTTKSDVLKTHNNYLLDS